MTLKERVIVEVYTGICMVTGDERNEVYKYMKDIMGRPVYTHELASKEICEQLKNKSKNDFVRLCGEPHTNAEKIRSMSDESLAELFAQYSCEDADYASLLPIKECKWGTKQEVISRNLKWLQSEAE